MSVGGRVQKTAHRRPVGLVWLGMLTYSTGPVIVAASSVDGAEFSIMRLVLGVPAIGLIALFARGDGKGWFPRSARLWTVLAGAAFGAHQLFFMTAVKLTSVTDVVLMNTLSPIVVMVLAVPMFGERTDLRFRGWTAVAIAGAAIVALGGAAGAQGDAAGMAMAAINVVFFSLFFLCSKAARPHVDVWPFLFVAITVAAVVVGLFVLISGQSLGNATSLDWALAVLLAAGPGAVGHFLMTWPLARVRANVPPVIRLLQPPSSGALAWLILGQPVTTAQLAGGALTVVGVVGVLGFWSSWSRSTATSTDTPTDTPTPH